MMDCSCVVVENEGPPAEFYDVVTRKARKQHVCSECGREIEKGEEYEVVSAKWEGVVVCLKTCSDCLAFRNAFFCNSFSHEMIWDDFREHLFYCDAHIDGEQIGKLPRRAREKVCEMIEEYWKRYEDEE